MVSRVVKRGTVMETVVFAIDVLHSRYVCYGIGLYTVNNIIFMVVMITTQIGSKLYNILVDSLVWSLLPCPGRHGAKSPTVTKSIFNIDQEDLADLNAPVHQ